MKKMEYIAPEIEVLEMELANDVLLVTSSDETIGIGGQGNDEEAG